MKGKTKSKGKGKRLSKIKSRILRRIAAEIEASGGPANVGHSKSDHLSSVFIKNPR
jgi:hypothetical protein